MLNKTSLYFYFCIFLTTFIYFVFFVNKFNNLNIFIYTKYIFFSPSNSWFDNYLKLLFQAIFYVYTV
jgi:hypothetical protein